MAILFLLLSFLFNDSDNSCYELTYLGEDTYIYNATTGETAFDVFPVVAYEWSRLHPEVAVIAHQNTDDIFLYDGRLQATTKIINLSPDENIWDVAWSDDETWIAYISTVGSMSQYHLTLFNLETQISKDLFRATHIEFLSIAGGQLVFTASIEGQPNFINALYSIDLDGQNSVSNLSEIIGENICTIGGTIKYPIVFDDDIYFLLECQTSSDIWRFTSSNNFEKISSFTLDSVIDLGNNGFVSINSDFLISGDWDEVTQKRFVYKFNEANPFDLEQYEMLPSYYALEVKLCHP